MESTEVDTDVTDLALVALTPADMAPAQAELLTWCDRKVAAVKAELADLEANLEIATASGWKHASVVASINRAAKRVLYYEKIQAAVAAGYLIVPNFPVDVFAVRVQRAKPRETEASYSRSGKFDAKPELLAAGEGRYVDDRVFTIDESYTETQEGKERRVDRHVSADYDAVDFPVTMVKPAILSATQRAMALKVFDQIGVVQNQSGRDPIIVGQLLDPRGNGRRATFFVAWWLNTRDL